MNIYVGNLPYDAREDDIRLAFEAYGQVTSVTLIKDKYTGEMRGFGFVEMANMAEAQAAIQGLNGKEFMARNLVVNPARPREERGEMRQGGYGGSRRRGDDPRRRQGNRRKRGGY